jgi:transcription elongation factor Elf1
MDFPCPGCGGQLTWKPGAGAMVCQHCGTEVQPPESEGQIREYRIEEASSKAPKGWGTKTKTIACDACGASYDLEPSTKASDCPFCGSSKVHDDPERDVIRPESVLPFAIEKTVAANQFRQWISGLWFRPSALKTSAQLENIAGVYIPAWTFDTQSYSQWQAESGEYYYEDEQVEVEKDGKKVTETRQVRKTRWKPAHGERRGAYDDWLVQASKGLDQGALKGLLPFDLEKLKAYDAAYLAGMNAERYSVGLEDAWKVAQKELDAEEEKACRDLVPGDTQRGLQVSSKYSDVRFKHTLLPVWIAAYRYEGQAYRYLVNGHSGKAYGDAPYSKWKMAGCALLVILAIMSCMGLFSAGGVVSAVLSR